MGHIWNHVEERLITYLRKRHKVRDRKAGYARFKNRVLYERYGLYKVPTTGLEEGACLVVKNIGKPCAGKPHARFDEGGLARPIRCGYLGAVRRKGRKQISQPKEGIASSLLYLIFRRGV